MTGQTGLGCECVSDVVKIDGGVLASKTVQKNHLLKEYNWHTNNVGKSGREAG